MAAPKLDSVLVVGGCGFLGHHIVQQLIDDKASDISVLDLRTTRNRLPNVQYYDGDITSVADVTSILQKVKPHIIINTASPLAAEWNPHSLYDKVNVQGTKNLLDCSSASGTVKVFIYTSSASIVHDTVSDLDFADETFPVLVPPRQREYYAYTKGVADGLVLAANRSADSPSMLTATIRPAGIFGEGDVQVIPGAVHVYQGGQTGVQIGDNSNYWDFTYVGNVAHAHLLAARALLRTHTMSLMPLDNERVDGEGFFVTNDEPLPFWTIMRKIWTAAGWEGGEKKPWVLPKGLGLFLAVLMDWIFWIVFWGTRQPRLKKRGVMASCQNRTYSIEKAKKRLGYKPLVSMDEGIERGVRWYLEQQKEAGEKKMA